VNGDTRYRLIPETAGDGLLMRAAPGVVAPGPFDPVPEAWTIAVGGAADHLTYRFYETRLAPPRRVRTLPSYVRQSANARVSGRATR
jgi:hypothetical protein